MRSRWKPIVATVLIILLITGYFVFYYSRWSVQQVPAGVDALISIDKKRLIRTIGWEYITHPSRWKGSLGSDNESDTSLTDLLQIPDYCILFRLKEAPADGFCLRLEIKDKPLLLLYLRNQQFQTNTIGGGRILVEHPSYPVQALISGNDLLLSKSGAASEQVLIRSADLLFNQHQYANEAQINAVLSQPAHVNFWSDGTRESGEAWRLQANYKEDSIVIQGSLPWQAPSKGTSANTLSARPIPFRWSIQNSAWFADRLSIAARNELSRSAGFSIDSVFALAGTSHRFELTGIHTRNDSSIQISTDENFNEVRDTVLNTVREPELKWTIYGPKCGAIVQYFSAQHLIDSSSGMPLFRPIPLVPVRIQSFSNDCIWLGSNWLQPTAQEATAATNQSPLFEMEADLSYWFNEFKRVFKPEEQKWFSNLGLLTIRINPAQQQAGFSMTLQKKQEQMPLFDWY